MSEAKQEYNQQTLEVLNAMARRGQRWRARRSGTKRCPICGSPAHFERGVWRCKCNEKRGQ